MLKRAPAPESDGLRPMIDAALPGGRVTSVRRLRGGLSAHVHVIGVVLPGGGRTLVVLRRRGAEGGHLATPERAVAEYRTLIVLNEAGVPAPRPLLLDAEGRYFGAPAILMSYDGRPVVSPRNVPAWLAGLADALVKLATVTPDRFDLSFLNVRGIDAMQARIERPLPVAIAADPLALEVAAMLRRHLPSIARSGPRLVHRDFWPGNTVWRRGRLSAIVDWSTAAVGDPRIDIAQCRVDLAMMHGPEMADAFLDAYRARCGASVPDLWFFDLLIGLDDALATFREWLPGYHDIGLTHLREDVIEARLRAFLMRALRQAA